VAEISPQKLSPERIDEFRTAILGRYRENPREFPWRETTDPYEILVSEIMLQQTQTERVVPKYLAWLSLFPDAKTLAAAPFSQVLEAWIGLGYNRRARFLQEACRTVCDTAGGIFPSDPDELDALPGIGPYTARAVSTFAFGLPNVFIETNIRSVFIFFFFAERETVTDAEILSLIEATLPPDNPREWYYALMDYGAALKKTVKNPNRKSSHYTKQSAFEGSLRQARGAAIRSLSALGEATAAAIADNGHVDGERLGKALEALVAEGLVAERGGVYRIS